MSLDDIMEGLDHHFYGGYTSVTNKGHQTNEKIEFTIVNLFEDDIVDQVVSCKPSLVDDSYWKVTITELSIDAWLYLGIIGTTPHEDDSSFEPPHRYADDDDFTSYGWTSYGWSEDKNVYVDGEYRYAEEDDDSGGWTQFTEGECLYFRFQSNQLTMHSVQKNRSFRMDIAAPTATATRSRHRRRDYHIHFYTWNSGATLTLEPLVEERQRALVR